MSDNRSVRGPREYGTGLPQGDTIHTTVILMSDIHGNAPALHAVAGSLPEHDAVFVAGDLCFDGPSPEVVVDFIREQGWTAVMGNTDRDLVSPDETEVAKRQERLAWTRDVLGAERLGWLGALPFSTRFSSAEGSILIVHANPLDMNTHLQPTMSEADLQPYLEGLDADILAFGHLHIPYLRPVGGVLLADVSSVGHPKDRDRRAAYTVVRWEGNRRSVEQVRVPYDLDETLHLLHTSGMPFADEQAEDLLRASY
jgi:predicted phosphodiesterase